MRAVIAGGGTGGHLFPGIAIASELVSRESGNEVLFVGTRSGIEERVVPAEGYPIRFIRVSGLMNVGFTRTLKSLMAIPGSLSESREILEAFDPHVVFGVGGYASGPVVAMAHWLGFPTVIHEQNAVPGLTNRILGRFADAIAVSYPDSKGIFRPDRTHLTGNPVRKTIGTVERRAARQALDLSEDLFTVFICGGSGGAHSINQAMIEALPLLEGVKGRLQWIHQTGQKDEATVKEAYRKAELRGMVSAFFQRMEWAYAAADLVICRAGASTLAELAAAGRASVLVPYPHAAANHQEMNARKLVDMGACRLILDHEISGERLAAELMDLLDDPTPLASMERASRSMSRPASATRIVDIAYELCRRKGVL